MLFLTSIFDLKYLRPQIKYQKDWSADFVLTIRELFLPIFSFLALKLWEEIEATDRQTFFTNSTPLLKNLNSHLTSLALLRRDLTTISFPNHENLLWDCSKSRQNNKSHKIEKTLHPVCISHIIISLLHFKICYPNKFTHKQTKNKGLYKYIPLFLTKQITSLMRLCKPTDSLEQLFFRGWKFPR